jgi:hypothetical protein
MSNCPGISIKVQLSVLHTTIPPQPSRFRATNPTSLKIPYAYHLSLIEILQDIIDILFKNIDLPLNLKASVNNEPHLIHLGWLERRVISHLFNLSYLNIRFACNICR